MDSPRLGWFRPVAAVAIHRIRCCEMPRPVRWGGSSFQANQPGEARIFGVIHGLISGFHIGFRSHIITIYYYIWCIYDIMFFFVGHDMLWIMMRVKDNIIIEGLVWYHPVLPVASLCQLAGWFSVNFSKILEFEAVKAMLYWVFFDIFWQTPWPLRCLHLAWQDEPKWNPIPVAELSGHFPEARPQPSPPLKGEKWGGNFGKCNLHFLGGGGGRKNVTSNTFEHVNYTFSKTQVAFQQQPSLFLGRPQTCNSTFSRSLLLKNVSYIFNRSPPFIW